VNKKKTGLETCSLKKTKHSSRRLKIAERNYCLMTVPSTAEMKLAWCSLHTINSRNPNDGREAVNGKPHTKREQTLKACLVEKRENLKHTRKNWP
jgi:hypothetical protein